MDPNSLQHLPGMAYMQKLGRESQSQIPFAEYDLLTPDEPIQAWRLGKRLLSNLRNKLVSPHDGTRYQQDISKRQSITE